MKISVVTVAFNSSATIVDTLRSVGAQRHGDVEHIVVDGGSTDDTLDLVRRHGERVTQIVSEPDDGIYDAMNKGLRLASGDLVGFLNADDMLADPGTLVAMAAAAQRTEADAVFGDLVYVDKERIADVVRYWRAGPFSRSRLRFGWMPPHPTFYVRRRQLATLGGFDAGLRIAADYDFMLRCLGQPGFVATYVPQVLVHMRMGGASNRSWRAMWRKSHEDWIALRRSGVGGVLTLLCKNARKLPQFVAKPPQQA